MTNDTKAFVPRHISCQLLKRCLLRTGVVNLDPCPEFASAPTDTLDSASVTARAARARTRMEILDLRHFSSADLRPLMEDETQVWSRLLSWDYSGSAEMILRYVDAKILPGYAAIERGRIFGYSFFVYEGSKGVIGDLYVTNGNRLPDARKVELQLLTHVIETLQQSPGIHRIEAQLLAHDAGAVARPFTDQGFQRHGRLFMALPLSGEVPAATMNSSDVEIRQWSEPDYQSAAGLITNGYRGHVDSQINDQYR